MASQPGAPVPWHAIKAWPANIDTIVRLRRVLIAAQFSPAVPRQPTTEEIRTIRVAWAQAAA